MPRGGARTGAGRPKTAERFADKIEKAEDKLARNLLQITDILIDVAKGNRPTKTTTYELAATLTRDGTEVHDNEKTGPRSVRVKVPVFPNAKEGEMVMTKQVITEGVNLAGVTDVLNRIMGTPTVRQEISGPDGGAIPYSLEDAIDKVYGDRPKPPPKPKSEDDDEDSF